MRASLAGALARLALPQMTRWRVAGGILVLLVVSLLLRTTAIHGRYWIDEGLSVGIAGHPLADIPGLLRQDGAPPLYYLLLGVWTRIFGDGEARTHALSLGFALLTIPVGFAAARALFSERAAWFAAVVAAVLPFLSYYSQETRMYTLVVLLSMIVMTTFVLVFIQGRRRWLAGFVASGAMLLYTHNWGLFLLAASFLALVPLLRSRTVPLRDVLIGYGAIALLYLPWLPTLMYQAAHTGAPWSNSPSLLDLPGGLADLVGGSGPGVALLLVGGSGLLALWAIRSEPLGPRTQQAATVSVIGVTIVLGIALAFVASQISPGWTLRYFAAFVGPLILLAGGVLAPAGNLGLATVALLAGLWLHPPTGRVNNKSNVHHVSILLQGRVAPGDIVVSTQPEQVPVEAFYFPPGLRWASGMGWWPDTRVVDWRDALDRYRAARVKRTANTFVRALKPGQQLVLVQPILRTATWNAPWTRLVRRRSKQWERYLDGDRLLSREAAVPHLGTSRLPHGIRVVLYSRSSR
ncbi:MAG: mannosyltransferase [Solirubrobacteraceae bacterium]|nr:mannosyltransferase [Solirubrobacteraceae bacterium]